MIVLATFRLKYNLHLWEERVEVQRLIVCLRRKYDLVYAAFGEGISERDCSARGTRPRRNSAVFVCSAVSEWLECAVWGTGAESGGDIRCWSAMGCVEDVAGYSIPG